MSKLHVDTSPRPHAHRPACIIKDVLMNYFLGLNNLKGSLRHLSEILNSTYLSKLTFQHCLASKDLALDGRDNFQKLWGLKPNRVSKVLYLLSLFMKKVFSLFPTIFQVSFLTYQSDSQKFCWKKNSDEKTMYILEEFTRKMGVKLLLRFSQKSRLCKK
jgi:hypothetical protein